MEALRQQLEGQHKDHSDHVDQQLRSQYMQAVCSLREALQDSGQQKELDAVVGQLQELHQQQLQQLHAQHLHETTLQVTAMRVTVEQVQESRFRLVEEQHSSVLHSLQKQHKEEINALQAGLSPSVADGISPLSANEELTQQYQNLVQRISQSLEKEVLGRLCGGEENRDENRQADEAEEAKTNGNGVLSDDSDEAETRHGVSPSTISKEQAEAIQQTLQAQQEEVLSLRSRLLQDYEAVLQQRTVGVSQQTQDVRHLQDQMAQLQDQYQQQIAEFQARISQHDEEDERRQAEQQQHVDAMEEMKAKYEQRISDMEESFSEQIASLQQQQAAVLSIAPSPHHELVDINDGGDSGVVHGVDSGVQTAEHTDSDPDSLSIKLEPERDYVHRTATLTAISDVDSDTADSPRSGPPKPPSSPPSRLQQLQETVEEKTAHVSELEKKLEEERERMSDLVGQLDSASHRLSNLSGQLEEQRQLAESLQERLKERDWELEQAFHEKAESEKLLQEVTEKEMWLEKEKENLEEELKCLKELDDALLTSTPTVEDELKQLRISLKETSSALRTVEAREAELREKLLDAEHQHSNALDELRQELEHEAQVERETLQSEFLVQLDVELKRQAAELEKQFAEKTEQNGKNSDIPGRTVDDEADRECLPDMPHAEESVQSALTATLNMSPPTSDDHDNQESVIHQSTLSLQLSTSMENSGTGDSSRAGEVNGQPQSAVSLSADSPVSSGAFGHEEKKCFTMTDLNNQLTEQWRQYQVEKIKLVTAHEQRVEQLTALVTEAEEKYNRLKEDVEEREGAGVETLLKDRYDMELDLAKNLMQQEFDETLQAEKKKFVERHRKLMDDFMTDQETEAAEIKEKHEQELEHLRSSISTQYSTQIDQLQAELQLYRTTDSNQNENGGEKTSPEEITGVDTSDELNRLKSELEEEKKRLEMVESDHGEALNELEGVKEQLEKSRTEQAEAAAALQDAQSQLEKLRTDHAQALSALREEHEARISELKRNHQDELEAVALDTDVMKSELEQAHQAEVEQLRERLAAAEQQAQHTQQQDTTTNATTTTQQQTVMTTKETATATSPLRHVGRCAGESYRPGPEAMHAVSEITLPLHLSSSSPKGSSRSGGREGDLTPDLRSSLEYETTDEEGSVHSFSSMVGKPKSFADAVKSPPPTSSPPQQDQRIKELEAQVEQLTQQLEQQQEDSMMTPTRSTLVASSPPPSPASAQTTPSTITSSPPQQGAMAAAVASQAGDGGDHSLIHMLQLDLDRLSAERDMIQQTNNRLLQLLSDSVHTYVEVEDSINRRLHTMLAATSSSSAPHPHTPTHPPRPDAYGDLVTPRGAGLSSFMGMAGDRGAVGGAGMAVSSPQSDYSWKHRDADTSSPTLEETSILSSATDEGLDISQRLTESIFTGPDIDAEGEEIVSDARGRLQNAVTRLLEMMERTMQQLMEAKATQSELLETMAARTRDADDLRTRLRDLEEQVRQEVSAKEYLGMELHKAEGLVSGYSSERESLEEQLQSLEEQKEVLASDLETTRSRLRDFQEATGELEARRLDVERQQSLLQENSGHEAQGSNFSITPSPSPPLPLPNARPPSTYTFLIVPLGVFVGAYLFREWMLRDG